MYAYKFSRPRWDGTPLEGRTLLVYAEQGFGDNIQFCRYLPLITEGGVSPGKTFSPATLIICEFLPRILI